MRLMIVPSILVHGGALSHEVHTRIPTSRQPNLHTHSTAANTVLQMVLFRRSAGDSWPPRTFPRHQSLIPISEIKAPDRRKSEESNYLPVRNNQRFPDFLPPALPFGRGGLG